MSFDPVTLTGRPDGAHLVLSCEHASAAMPAEYANLGLGADELADHIGWDIGAAAVVTALSRGLGAPAVLSAASRLLVDCNRDVGDADLMPHTSHGTAIPGNACIAPAEHAARLGRFYDPFHAAVDAQLAQCPGALLLSVHSFTPSLRGAERGFDVGVLFDDFDDVAHAFADRIASSGFSVRLNEPYSGLDGLIYSARRHGRRHRVLYLELEINNRLIGRDDEAQDLAARLAAAVAWLARSPSVTR